MLSLGKISGKSIEFPKTAYGLKLYQKQILDEYQEEIAKVKEDYESILAKYESEKIAYISTLKPQSSRAQTVRRANLIKNEIDNDIESVLEESNVDTTATKQPGKLSFSSTLKSPAKKNPEGINKRDSNYRNGDRAYRATRQTQIRASR